MSVNIGNKFVIKVSNECYDEIRKALIALGDGGVIDERYDRRLIDMTHIVIEAKPKGG
jgi:hypothetical protein